MTFNLAQTFTANAELVRALSDSYEVRTPASPASQTLKVSERLQNSHLHVNSRSKTCLSVPASPEFLRKSSPAKTCCLCMNSSWRGCVCVCVVRRGLAEAWCVHRLSAGHICRPGSGRPSVPPSPSLLLAPHIPMSLGSVCPSPPIQPARFPSQQALPLSEQTNRPKPQPEAR